MPQISLPQDSESSQSSHDKNDRENENKFNFNFASCFSELQKTLIKTKKTLSVVKSEMIHYQSLAIISFALLF